MNVLTNNIESQPAKNKFYVSCILVRQSACQTTGGQDVGRRKQIIDLTDDVSPLILNLLN